MQSTGLNCSISGCTSMSVSLVSTGINPVVERMGGIDTFVTDKSSGIKVTTCLVCKTSQGAWEYLWVEEGQLYELNGEKVMVRRK